LFFIQSINSRKRQPIRQVSQSADYRGFSSDIATERGHSWERGLNENNSALLRHYFPKGMELTKISQEHALYAVDGLNHSPRNVLGLKTPFEVIFGKTVRYTKPQLAVALRN